MIKQLRNLSFALLFVAASLVPAQANQSSGCLPTSSLPGLTLVNTLNAWMKSISTTFSGTTAPVTDCSAVVLTGQPWLDSTTSGYLKAKLYDGTSSVSTGWYDTTNHLWVPPIGGGTATLSSATTTDLWSVPQAAVTVSGTTTITALASASAVPGTIKKVTFSGILTLTHNGTSLILPTAANITTTAGDTAEVEAINSTNVRVRNYQLASGAPLSTTAVSAASLLASAQGMNAPLNLRINATVGSSALTVAIKTAANADATSGSPVLIPFRDATIANGDPVISSLQAALSITIASTNTLGTSSSNIPFHLWVIAYYNGGTLAVGLFNASTATQIFGLPESNLITTAASTNGGSNAGTHYANVSTITNTPYRILGYLEWGSGLTTAGTWASGPTKIVLFGPGIKKPGDIVQGPIYLVNTQSITSSGATPTATNLTNSIVPTSSANLIRIDARGTYNSSAGFPPFAQIYRGTSTPIGTECGISASPAIAVPCSMLAIDAPGVTSSVAYTVYTWATGGANSVWNAQTINCTMTLEEIMGEIDEPANDNLHPGTFSLTG